MTTRPATLCKISELAHQIFRDWCSIYFLSISKNFLKTTGRVSRYRLISDRYVFLSKSHQKWLHIDHFLYSCSCVVAYHSSENCYMTINASGTSPIARFSMDSCFVHVLRPFCEQMRAQTKPTTKKL